MTRRVLVAGAVLLAQLTVTPATSGGSRGAQVIDLRRAPNWMVVGSFIGPAGDSNGDGIADAALSNCAPGDGAGRVRVVWGPFHDGEVRAPADTPGYTIFGAEAHDGACRLPVSPVGDVNGDGLDDLIVGASMTDPPGRSAAGTVYVVFGKTGSEDVDLKTFDVNAQGTAGFRIDGPSGLALVGRYLDGIGDMNRDGYADILVGAPFAAASYVVFGKATPTPVDLLTFHNATQGDQGFRIDTYGADASDLYSVAGAGDVNGDSAPDVVVGVVPRMYDSTGSAFVVFGKSDSAPVNARKPSLHGFKIKGVLEGENNGSAVGGAGDVNGDGLDDVIVGASKSYSCCRGRATVVFGKKDTKEVLIADLGRQGFKIAAPQNRDAFGRAVTGVGDVDGDGYDDVAIGADWLSYRRRGNPGGVFVVYGKRSVKKVRAARLRGRGFVIVGGRNGDRLGYTLARPGDVNNDGVPDLMVSEGGDEKTYLLWLHDSWGR